MVYGRTNDFLFRHPIVRGHRMDRAWLRSREDPRPSRSGGSMASIPRSHYILVYLNEELDTPDEPPAFDGDAGVAEYMMDADAGTRTLEAFVAQRRAEFGRFSVSFTVTKKHKLTISVSPSRVIEEPSRVIVSVEVEEREVAWWWDELLAMALDAVQALGVRPGDRAVMELEPGAWIHRLPEWNLLDITSPPV